MARIETLQEQTKQIPTETSKGYFREELGKLSNKEKFYLATFGMGLLLIASMAIDQPKEARVVKEVAGAILCLSSTFLYSIENAKRSFKKS